MHTNYETVTRPYDHILILTSKCYKKRKFLSNDKIWTENQAKETSFAGGRHNCSSPLQVDLVTLQVPQSRVKWATYVRRRTVHHVPILVFLGLSVLDL